MTDLTVVDAAVEKMRWHEARQKGIAKNISNVNTPGYQAEEVQAPDFKKLLKSTSSAHSISMATTNSKHLNLNGAADGEFATKKVKQSTSASGNTVSLEDQMMDMNDNAIDHRFTTTIYQKQIQFLERSTK